MMPVKLRDAGRWSADFPEPKSLAEGEQRLDELKNEIQRMEANFAMPDRVNRDTGEKMGEDEYRQWRYKANVALRYRVAELRALKRWVFSVRDALNTGARLPQKRRAIDILADVVDAYGPLDRDRLHDLDKFIAAMREAKQLVELDRRQKGGA